MLWEVYKRLDGFVSGQFATEKGAREYALIKNQNNAKSQVWIVRRTRPPCATCGK